MKLDQRTSQALHNLKNNQDFAVYLTALGTFSEDLMQKYVYANKENRATMQGKTQCIAEIVKAIVNADKQLAAFKARGNDTQI